MEKQRSEQDKQHSEKKEDWDKPTVTKLPVNKTASGGANEDEDFADSKTGS